MKNRAINLLLAILCFPLFLNGKPIEFKQQILSEAPIGAQKVLVADLDKDGDLDILAGAKHIIWWENIGDKNYTQHTAVQNAGSVIGMSVIDMDKDGDMDILSASYLSNAVFWWKNDGKQNFEKVTIDDNFLGSHDVAATDINQDGFLDVVAARGDQKGQGEIAVWINNKANGFEKQVIYSGLLCHSISTGDLNGDGKTDILGTQFREGVRVWKNMGDLQFKEYFLPLKGAHEVTVSDIDGDNMPDVLAAGYMANSIIWWKNQGDFTFAEQKVSEEFLGAVTVDACDIDGDGDMDIFGGSDGAHDIRWWENTNSGEFTEHSIAGFLFKASGIGAGDIDNDGDMDIVGSAWKGTGEVTLWENTGEDTMAGQMEDLSGRRFISYLREHGIDDAVKLYEKIKLADAGKIIFTQNQFIYLGYEFLQLKKHGEAIKIFELLTKEYPKYANGYDSLGEAYMKAGNNGLAIQNYQKSLELNPENKNAEQQLSLLNRKDDKKYNNYKELSTDAIGLWRTGERDKAIDLYQKALQLFPENKLKSIQNLAFMYTQSGNTEKAFDVYEYGHTQGLYYSFNAESGPAAQLMQHERFKKIYQKNRELIKKAQENSKPHWEIIAPENYDQSKKYPLLIVMHGFMGSLETINPMWKTVDYSSEIIIAHLQSSQILGMGSFAWDDINTTQKDISALLDFANNNYPVDKEKIIIAGFSQGGAAAIKLTIDDMVQVSGFIAHCPGGKFITELNPDNLKSSAEKGIKGVVISTENDHSKALQKKMITEFEASKLKHEYIEIAGVGHWYPKDFSTYLDSALKSLFE